MIKEEGEGGGGGRRGREEGEKKFTGMTIQPAWLLIPADTLPPIIINTNNTPIWTKDIVNNRLCQSARSLMVTQYG